MHIQVQLEKYLSTSKENMSSYGIRHLYNANYADMENGMNSGTFANLNLAKKIKFFFYNILINIIFGIKINNNYFYKKFKQLCKKQNRLFDLNLIQCSIMLEILNKYQLLNKKICVIGDGKANFITGCLFLEKNTTLYTVNLPQALIQDYNIIKKFNLIDDKKIKVVNNEKDLDDNNIKLFLIPASNKEFLKNRNINLFTNSSSFQEMPPEETTKYFEIIKTNKGSSLYCVNAEKKIMYDGIEINYKEFPFHLAKKIIFEKEATFTRKYYNLRPFFIHRLKNKCLQTLAQF